MFEETNLLLVEEFTSRVKAKNKIKKFLTPTELEFAWDYVRGIDAGIVLAEQNLDEALEELRRR